MSDDATTFHRRVARELLARYGEDAHAPETWREIASWHWAQAGAYAEAADEAISVAEAQIARIDFVAARRWAERALEYLDRLPLEARRSYDIRAYAVAMAVLEFGGQYREALGYAERMLRAARGGTIAAQVQALLAVGRMQRALNQLPQAETTLTEARDLAERDEAAGEFAAEIRFHLAKTHQMSGRHIEALQELQLAQEEHEQSEDQQKLARVFTAVGDVYRVLGASKAAMSYYQRALALEQGRSSPRGQAILKDKIALSLLEQDRSAEAEIVGQESLQIRTLLNDNVGLARSYSVLGTIAHRLGRYEQAIQYHERARELEEQIQNRRGSHVALLHLGDAYVALKRFDDATAAYQQAYGLAQQSGDAVALARTFERLGHLSAISGKVEAARASWREALSIRERLGHADEAANLRDLIALGTRTGT